MALKSLIEMHLKMHKFMHPFDHFAHGSFLILVVLIAKFIMGCFFAFLWHISAAILFIAFVITTITRYFAEAIFLKKKKESKYQNIS